MVGYVLAMRRVAIALLAICTVFFAVPGQASNKDGELGRLQNGDVVVDLRKIDGINFVSGKILIDEPPNHVWPIMTNPYEFEGKITPRMKQVRVMIDKPDFSLLKCTINVGMCFIPSITYVVESKYDLHERIVFKRVDGDLRDFKGVWEVRPEAGGRQTELTYSMYIDPGFPVPQWLIREGVKFELPHTLSALRKRVKEIYRDNKPPESRSILASGVVARTSFLFNSFNY